eukprot:m.606067 g.606067  ORF g.606067 m.606067 type:complete len:328 (+) comp58111_c0_seq6:259-1242(+)
MSRTEMPRRRHHSLDEASSVVFIPIVRPLLPFHALAPLGQRTGISVSLETLLPSARKDRGAQQPAQPVQPVQPVEALGQTLSQHRAASEPLRNTETERLPPQATLECLPRGTTPPPVEPSTEPRPHHPQKQESPSPPSAVEALSPHSSSGSLSPKKTSPEMSSPLVAKRLSASQLTVPSRKLFSIAPGALPLGSPTTAFSPRVPSPLARHSMALSDFGGDDGSPSDTGSPVMAFKFDRAISAPASQQRRKPSESSLGLVVTQAKALPPPSFARITSSSEPNLFAPADRPEPESAPLVPGQPFSRARSAAAHNLRTLRTRSLSKISTV